MSSGTVRVLRKYLQDDGMEVQQEVSTFMPYIEHKFVLPMVITSCVVVFTCRLIG